MATVRDAFTALAVGVGVFLVLVGLHLIAQARQEGAGPRTESRPASPEAWARPPLSEHREELRAYLEALRARARAQGIPREEAELVIARFLLAHDLTPSLAEATPEAVASALEASRRVPIPPPHEPP